LDCYICYIFPSDVTRSSWRDFAMRFGSSQ
jgi:hypothetical protein